MLKIDELRDHNSCLNKAKDDEPVFVLLGRDLAAPDTIRKWAYERIMRNLNTRNDPKIVEALAMADRMEHYGRAHLAAKLKGGGGSGDAAREVLRTLYPDSDIDLVLSNPQPLLNGKVPNDLIAAGQEQMVVDAFRAMASGAHA